MILTEIKGGLGNQMFQYACGRMLSVRLSTELTLDLNFFSEQLSHTETTIREFELDLFKLPVKFLSSSESTSILRPSRIRRAINHLLPFSSYTIFTEDNFRFQEQIINQKINTYLQGYWQSEKYFKSIENLIRNDFTFPDKIGEENKSILHKIHNSNSISIHVRRGDYVMNKKNLEFHGVLPQEYYTKGIDLIESKIKDPVYYIFTDEPNWALENLVRDKSNIHLITNNIGKDSWKDMYLMSQCKHNIIANSSFSWWGAWLNSNLEKIIVAPEKWFATQDPFFNTEDLIPKNWIKISW